MAGPKAIWGKAIETFLSEDRQAGSVITHDWLLEQFSMEIPGVLSRDEWAKWELRFLSYFMPFRDHLLRDHYVDLQPIGDRGFMVIPPSEQTKSAMLELGAKYKQVHKRCGNRLKFVNKDGLTQQQVQENADALAKVAHLKAMSTPIF